MLEKLPLPGNVNPAALKEQANEQQIKRQIAIINSMTPGERRFPKTINGSRKKRIAAGAGQQIQDVNRLLKQHLQMEKMMKKMSKGGMKKMLRGMPGGGMPPGLCRLTRMRESASFRQRQLRVAAKGHAKILGFSPPKRFTFGPNPVQCAVYSGRPESRHVCLLIN